MRYIKFFNEITKEDVNLVGGKNANLGEMYNKLSKKGVNVPKFFALTTKGYWRFVKFNNIDKELKEIFKKFNPDSIKSLQETSKKARSLFLKGKFPKDLEDEIINAYKKLCKIHEGKDIDVAVRVAIRSSGVAEDQPKTSFAGQFETYLNILGKENLLEAVKKCFASGFTERVIAYREENKINHLKFALSICIQKMVRSDIGSSGVMFTLDTESGFRDVIVINSIYGLGEMIVRGKITPDEFYVFKPTLKNGYKPIIVKNLGRKTKKYVYAKKGGVKEVKVSKKDQEKFSLSDEEVLKLARWGILIEEHYKYPQDIEWAKDGQTGELFIVQSRPETVHAPKKIQFYEEYNIKTDKKPILTGIAIGNKIGQGKVHIIEDVSKINEFKKGEILVTKMTDPDWVPAIRIASGIITDEGSKLCHAAIISRELGIPAIVGTKNATNVLKNGQEVTMDCTSSEGKVFLGKVPYDIKKYNLKKISKLKTKVMINIGAPEIAFQTSFLPNDGVGLARIEFILTEKIRIHPLALYYYEKLKKKIINYPNNKRINNYPDINRISGPHPGNLSGINPGNISKIIKQIDKLTIGYEDKKQFFIDKLAEGIAQVASAFYPKPVIVRFSDFKTNEYKNLIGGELFEPEESNPMLGWRGASRYYDEKFKPAFKMECEAIKKAREVFGLKNIWVMVPFCRTIEEGKNVVKLIEENGLKKSKGLKIIVMCEIPSNVILADEFLKIFDGFSIGSNDLTQLVLGIDRDSAITAKIGDERNPAVLKMIEEAIRKCREKNKYVGICGQAPSDFPEIVEFLVKNKITSISVNPDVVIKTINLVKKAEDKYFK
jgi:pyruvate,water dikinase